MINFREIFNQSNMYIGISIIIIISIILLIINRNIINSLYKISRDILVASLMTLSISFILKFIINIAIPINYKIVVEIISNNVATSLFNISILAVIISSIILITLKILMKKEIENKKIISN